MSAPETFAERAVARVAQVIDRSRHDRRGFLGRVALAGSALAVQPWGFLVRDASAYDVVCGDDNECADGWTAFCCTVGGTNSCPPGSFAAGWWKADASGFCCGSARYYIDCNASCGSGWTCSCAEGTCDRRRVACNQFRYGQCHQEIACYGPVVCRVVTCTPPWDWDGSCTTSSATDNRTASHSAPCLTADCLSDADRLYKAMGGSGGILGPLVMSEVPIRPAGYQTTYTGGAIYRWNSSVYEVHGAIWDRYRAMGTSTGILGLPTSSTRTAPDGVGRYNTFQYGAIYYTAASGAHEVHGALLDKWMSIGSGTSYVGYPTSDTASASWDRGRYNNFERGAIYWRPNKGAWEVHGAIFDKWDELGRENSLLNFPTSDTGDAARDRGRYSMFDTGAIFWRPNKGAFEVHGALYDKWTSLGRENSLLNFPTSDTQSASWGGGRFNEFDTGAIYWRPNKGAWEVHGALFDKWDELGRENSSLGYPVSDTLTALDGGRYNDFEHGRLTYSPVTRVVTVS